MAKEMPKTGDVLLRAKDDSGTPYIVAAVSMPVEAWDALTGDLKDYRRWLMSDDGLPELTLEERIAEFVTQRAAEWADDHRPTQSVAFDDGWDDEFPF